MNLTSIKENIKKRGLIGAIKSYTKKFLETNSRMTPLTVIRTLFCS